MYDLSKRFTLWHNLHSIHWKTLHFTPWQTLHPTHWQTIHFTLWKTLHFTQGRQYTPPLAKFTLHPLEDLTLHPLADLRLDPFQTCSFQQQLDFWGKQSATLKIQGYRLFTPLYIARYTSSPLSLQPSLLPSSPYINPSVPPSQVLSIHN